MLAPAEVRYQHSLYAMHSPAFLAPSHDHIHPPFALAVWFGCRRKYHIIQYEPVIQHPMLHHGVAYTCLPSDVPQVEALPNLGPYDRLTQGMLCEQFFMVGVMIMELYSMQSKCLALAFEMQMRGTCSALNANCKS